MGNNQTLSRHTEDEPNHTSNQITHRTKSRIEPNHTHIRVDGRPYHIIALVYTSHFFVCQSVVVQSILLILLHPLAQNFLHVTVTQPPRNLANK